MLTAPILQHRRKQYPLYYSIKSEGQPCQQGETASQSGCVPANGDAVSSQFIGPSEEQISEIRDMGGNAEPNQKLPNNSRPELSSREIKEVQSYLSEETEYYEVNEHLRNGGKLGYGPDALQSAIEKVEPFDKPVMVTRGLSVDDVDGLIEELKTGVYSDRGFMSTSTGQPFRGNVQLTIHVRKGLDASFYGNNSEEMLLPAGSEFKVIGYKQKGDKVSVELEQIIGDEEQEKSGPVNPTIKSMLTAPVLKSFRRKSFLYSTKAQCQQGQTAANTDCTPASGEGGKKQPPKLNEKVNYQGTEYTVTGSGQTKKRGPNKGRTPIVLADRNGNIKVAYEDEFTGETPSKPTPKKPKPKTETSKPEKVESINPYVPPSDDAPKEVWDQWAKESDKQLEKEYKPVDGGKINIPTDADKSTFILDSLPEDKKKEVLAIAKARLSAQPNKDWELKKIQLADITPSQEGEDRLNESSINSAKLIASGNLDQIPKADLVPIILTDDLNISDGNHRYTAAEMNGQKYIYAYIPKVKTGPVNPTIKSFTLPYSVKGTCKQGQTATNTDCTPASSEKGLKSLGSHKKGCLLLPIPEPLAKSITDWSTETILDTHLAEEGRELSPHVTCLYGFPPDFSEEQMNELRGLLARVGPIEIKLAGLDAFRGGKDGDVLYASVESPQLVELNAMLVGVFGIESDYDTYTPHCTIAYLQHGNADLYLEETPPFIGQSLEIDELEFFHADKRKERIYLNFLPQFGIKKYQPEGQTPQKEGQQGGETKPEEKLIESPQEAKRELIDNYDVDPEELESKPKKGESLDPVLLNWATLAELDRTVDPVTAMRIARKNLESNLDHYMPKKVKDAYGNEVELGQVVKTRIVSNGVLEKVVTDIAFPGHDYNAPAKIGYSWDLKRGGRIVGRYTSERDALNAAGHKSLETEDDKGIGATLESAGRWLAAKWAKLEARHGRRMALAIALSQLSPVPFVGTAVIAIAEATRGLRGYTDVKPADAKTLKRIKTMPIVPRIAKRKQLT